MSPFRLDGWRALVVGLGVSGESAARLAASLGAVVTVVDHSDDEAVRARAARLADVDVRLGAEGDDLVAASDVVVVSPGVRPDAAALRAARAAGVAVWSEVELAFRACKAPIVGVTGTNGKTTTTQMIAAALGAAGFDAVAAGNIGRALCDVAAERHDVVVAELSSFQLHHVDQFHAPIGVLLNIAEDHLDWHGSFEAYAADKARLFARQRPGDVALHLDDAVCERAAAAGEGTQVPFAPAYVPAGGAGVRDGSIVVPAGSVMAVDRLRTRGAPMIANAVAAAAAASAFGADLHHIARALAAFEPQPHRLELVAVVGGVSYVNDSKATNPHATLAALDGAHDVVLIAGGRNKGLDLTALAGARHALRAVVALGEAAPHILQAFDGLVSWHASSMEDAVRHAAALARRGDTVLLSPACASFDMFADYRARGEAFRETVKLLAGAGGEIP